MKPATLISLEDLSYWRSDKRHEAQTVAFVPTMGALHQGHLTLVKQAKEYADKVIVSIFVNPKQFGPNEDFAKYPRTIDADLKKLASLGVDAVFLPNAADIYPEDFQTKIHNEKMSQMLCGASRPGHFDGVLTIVMKLFNLVQPEYVLFGKKDYQQVKIIEQMVKDYSMNIKIITAETVRDDDGLALSSRNKFLSETERHVATLIFKALQKAKQVYESGSRSKLQLEETFVKVFSESSELVLEYFEVRKQKSLEEIEFDELAEPMVLLVAARLGTTRLIDNIELGG